MVRYLVTCQALWYQLRFQQDMSDADQDSFLPEFARTRNSAWFSFSTSCLFFYTSIRPILLRFVL